MAANVEVIASRRFKIKLQNVEVAGFMMQGKHFVKGYKPFFNQRTTVTLKPCAEYSRIVQHKRNNIPLRFTSTLNIMNKGDTLLLPSL